MTTIGTKFQAFLEDMRQQRELQPNTLRAYGYDLQHASISLTATLDMISRTDIETYLAQQTPQSRARRTTSLRQFFVWAIRNELCLRNPTDGLEPIHTDRQSSQPIRTQHERLAVDNAIAATAEPHRLVLTLLRETGMRIGEVLALNISDVALDVGQEGLRVRHQKHRSERIVILGPMTTPKSLQMLHNHMDLNRNEVKEAPLFRSSQSTRLSYDAVYYQWVHVCTQADLLDEHGKPRYTLHQLRQTRAAELLEQGQRREIVQQALGYRSVDPLLGHIDVSDMHVRAALETNDN